MMNRFYSWPIRLHLIILIALLAIPSIALIIHSGIAERHQAIADAKAESLKFVNDIASQQQNMVAGAEQLGAALSLLPAVRSHDREATNALFSELLKKNPQLVNIAICDKAGQIWASAVPPEGKVSVADRRFVREAIRTGTFSSGEYSVGRIVKRPVMSFGYPVKNAANEVVAVIGIILNLDYAQQVFERLNLPPNAAFNILDHQGTILGMNLNNPNAERFIGRRDPSGDVFTKMKQGPDEGTFEAVANDGRFRIAAYKRISLPQETEPYMYIRSSIPFASAVSKANAAMLRNLSVFVSLFLIGLVLAWLIGKRVIANPILLLEKASEQLAAGVDTVNVSRVVKSGELGDLARSFDDMAETLHHEKTLLRESEQRWATTLASIGDAVIATDESGRITFMNTIAEELTGWKITDAWMKPIPEVFHIVNEKTRQEVENPVEKVLREGMIVGLANHTILIKKDGTEVPIDDSAAPIRDEGGKTMGVVLVFRDITERKEAEEHTKHLASFPDLNPNPIIEVDLSGAITFCNPAGKNVIKNLGLNGEDCSCLLPTDLTAILRDWDKTSQSTVGREVTINEKVFAETVHLVPQFGVARIYAREITDRKRMEEEIRNALETSRWNEDQLQVLMENVHSAVALIDDSGRFSVVNRAFLDMFGLNSESDILNINSQDWSRWGVYGEDSRPLNIDDHPVRKAALTGKPVRNQLVAVRNPGATDLAWMLVNAEPLLKEDGTVYRIICTYQDVTEIKRAEETLRQAYDGLELRVKERTSELEEAYKDLELEMAERKQAEDALRQSQKMEAVGTLAGGIAHDFNNILAAIIGFTEMALEDSTDPEVKRHLQYILKSSMRARDLVKQILIFSRKTNYERSPLSLTPLIKETIQFLRASIPTTIRIDLAITASSDTILASPVEVQQILMNLATNASLAMQERGGTLEIALSDIDFTPESPVLEQDVMPGEYVQLTVKDTGIGMTPDVMKRVFEPFFTTREVGKGTGMGLAVVYGIVKDLQGTITVESTPGSGSTFQVFLPKVKASPLNDEISTVQAAKGTERILFIDDEPMLTEWGRTTLTRLGYKVTAVTDIKEALKLFSSDPSQFDLVITDHTMPAMTGVQFSKELLKIRPDIPIILCTGHSETVSPDIAREAGIKEYLMKPMAREEFAQAVRRVLDQKKKE
ncbi:MAG TPA: PAS domain S-box protein [Syntrophorhabdaceae bacterium]|nr:PAS domain S-box protein [Syntrophorhabdaceae bacterium]